MGYNGRKHSNNSSPQRYTSMLLSTSTEKICASIKGAPAGQERSEPMTRLRCNNINLHWKRFHKTTSFLLIRSNCSVLADGITVHTNKNYEHDQFFSALSANTRRCGNKPTNESLVIHIPEETNYIPENETRTDR